MRSAMNAMSSRKIAILSATKTARALSGPLTGRKKVRLIVRPRSLNSLRKITSSSHPKSNRTSTAVASTIPSEIRICVH